MSELSSWLRANRVPILVAVHSLCILVLVVTGWRASREDDLLRAVYEKGTRGAQSEEEKILTLRRYIHESLAARLNSGLRGVSGELEPLSPRSVGHEVVDPHDCASFAFAYARALQLGGHPSRVVAMTVYGVPGKHVVVETPVNGVWACMDPMHDVSWKREDGAWANCREVVGDWPRYVQQVSASYSKAMSYSPGGARYTNWDKVPVILPLVRWVLSKVLGGEQVETLSLRANTLNTHATLLWVAGPIYVLAVALALFRRRARS